jgi:maltooligosyltrehalose trehalohydrolase
MLRVAAGIVLTAPFTPMLFMGEEWGADTPFQFFTDHTDPYFAQAVSTGRRAEFTRHGWAKEDVPDPQDPQTYLRSKLDWTQPSREPYASTLEWYRQLIELRRAHPEITDPRLDRVRVDYDSGARWLLIHRGALRIAANLADVPARIPLCPGAITPVLLLASAPGITAHPDAIVMPAASFAVASTGRTGDG